MNGSIGRLRSDILVQRIPGNALDIVTVLGDLANQRSCLSIIDSRYVIHAANDEVDAIGRPGQVINLGTARTTHMLGSPRLLVI